MNQKIVQFQVSMNYLVIIQVDETCKNLFQNPPSFFLGKPLLLVQEFLDSAAIAELLHQIQVITSSDQLDRLNHVFAVEGF